MAEMVTVTHAFTVREEDVEKAKKIVTDKVRKQFPDAQIKFTTEPAPNHESE